MEEENEQENENIEEDFQNQLIEKIKHYYESNPPLSSKDELDNFLSAIDLLDIWNSEEEKENVWEYISKYMKDSKVDCEGTIKGIKDLLNQEEEQENTEKELPQKETLLSRLSRLSTKGIMGGPSNKLALNKYKQRAIDEYDCLDNNSLIQFKKIIALIKVNKSNLKINYDELNDIISKHKFIKIDINDIWKYLSFCVCEENTKNLEFKKDYNLNSDILEEVQDFIDQKIINEDLDYDSDNNDRDNDNDNDSVSSSGKKKVIDEDTIIFLEKIIKQSTNLNENNMFLVEIKNEIRKLNNNMIDCGYKILNKEELTMDEMENNKDLMNEKIYQIEEFYNKTKNENENNINKMELLKEKIKKNNENMKTLKEDYKALLEKYNNNQEIDIDEETERLLDENMMLAQEKENKEQEIEKLLNEKKTMRIEYQNLLMQYEDVIREKNELTQEASEIKINNYKLKNDYDKLLSDILNKMDNKEKEKKSKKKEKKEEKNEEKKNISYEEQIKEIKIINNSSIDESEKITRKKNILKDMANEKLINYIMELDKINQTLTNERNSKEQKIYELNQKNVDLNDQLKKLSKTNVDLEEENKNMQKKIENLNNEVKNNELFRPSIAMNSQMRISRLSKLNTVGINAQKFNIAKNVGFSTKKIETFKLKDKNINKKMGAQGQNTKFENISMDLYGVKEVDNEEEEQENKNEFNPTNQKILIISGDENKNKNNEISITNNNDINISGNDNNNQIKFNNNEVINNNQININNDNKKSNTNNNIIKSDNSFNISNNVDNKKNIELKDNSTSFDISGNTKSFNNLKQSGIVFNIDNTINNNDPNAVIEIENINDINLTSGDAITFGEIDSKENNNDVQFETQNNNLFIKKEEKNKNMDHKIASSFFETKPDTQINNDNNNKLESTSEKKEEKKEKEEIKEDEEIIEDIPILKIDNLMGNLLDNETINSNVNNSSQIKKNENNIAHYTKNEEENKNKNINEIHKENNININGDNNDINKNDMERSRTNTVVYNAEQRSTGNLEDIMFKGIQKEGFNIDNSSRKESFLQNNTNNINLSGEKKNNEINNKDKNENKKEYQIEKNKREIVMAPSTKMFQNTTSGGAQNFSINSNNINNTNHIQSNKTLVEKDFNSFRIGSSSEKIQIKPNHSNSIYSHYNYSNANFKNVFGFQRSKSELEEMRNNNSDYYSLYQEEYIQKKLKEEKDNCTEFDIYSDQIFLLIDKKHLSKRFIMLTPSNIYIIEPKEMKFIRIVKKENILSFQISNKNINAILFQIKDGDNILIETLRRMDLLSYLRIHYRNNNNLIKFKYEDKFIVKIKGKPVTISVKDKIFSNLSNFDGAQKIGYLLKLKFIGKLIFTNIFTEKLFILTSIGLIMFDEPSSPPKKLYPIIGSNIEKIEGNKYGRENCFKITFLSGKSKIFATRKKRERDSWLKEFDRIIKEFQNKMKQLDTINKKFIEYSDKSLLPYNKEEIILNEDDKNNKI